ncbi:hypothetical protein HYPDE_24578 [Hyphomicrobium denitrificans 1NES1]|uniref:Uncharacterized protein n=1 Tax=Hyphomicrobium denitrificans 1NES1 TaxID=670307 RepID=N0B7V1_9HYPH|nr:hypothetical protein HYPDE_24578 [Hyphomicrobium denitrificans 1NES1]
MQDLPFANSGRLRFAYGSRGLRLLRAIDGLASGIGSATTWSWVSRRHDSTKAYVDGHSLKCRLPKPIGGIIK